MHAFINNKFSKLLWHSIWAFPVKGLKDVFSFQMSPGAR